MNEETWYGQTVEAKSDPLADEGKGKPTAIRTFEFDVNPLIKQLPPNQELFNIHWPQVKNQLWKDGMVVREDVQPHLTFNKERTKYYIIIACEPRFNSAVIETPATLQDIFKS